MEVPVEVSQHAIRRYHERVDASLSAMQVATVLVLLAERALARPTPRHWMRKVTEARPGTRYLYPASHPDVCLVEREGAIVTVYSRAACRRMHDRRESVAPGRRQQTSRAARRRDARKAILAATVRP